MRRLLTALVLVAVFAGCSRPTTVRGTVTYEGEKLPNGYVTFFPVEGEGNSTGTEIINGDYFLAEATPGKMRAMVTTHPLAFVTKYKQGEKPTVRIQAVEAIPANAIGNNQIVEIKPGEQVIDLALRKPASRAP